MDRIYCDDLPIAHRRRRASLGRFFVFVCNLLAIKLLCVHRNSTNMHMSTAVTQNSVHELWILFYLRAIHI